MAFIIIKSNTAIIILVTSIWILYRCIKMYQCNALTKPSVSNEVWLVWPFQVFAIKILSTLIRATSGRLGGGCSIEIFVSIMVCCKYVLLTSNSIPSPHDHGSYSVVHVCSEFHWFEDALLPLLAFPVFTTTANPGWKKVQELVWWVFSEGDMSI